MFSRTALLGFCTQILLVLTILSSATFPPQGLMIKDFRVKNKIKPHCFGYTRNMRVLGLYFRISQFLSSNNASAHRRSPKASDQAMELSLDLELSIYEMLNIQTYLCSCQGFLLDHHSISLRKRAKSPAFFNGLKC